MEIENKQSDDNKVINIADYQLSKADRIRRQVRQENFGSVVFELRDLLCELHSELLFEFQSEDEDERDYELERVISVICEHSNLLEGMLGEICDLRDTDLGGKLNGLAEKLERSLSYLSGYLLVVAGQCVGSPQAWIAYRGEIRSAVSKALSTVRSTAEHFGIEVSDEEPNLPEAA